LTREFLKVINLTDSETSIAVEGTKLKQEQEEEYMLSVASDSKSLPIASHPAIH
jgi:hypothetical protein